MIDPYTQQHFVIRTIGQALIDIPVIISHHAVFDGTEYTSSEIRGVTRNIIGVIGHFENP